jgi:hypothetical protein
MRFEVRKDSGAWKVILAGVWLGSFKKRASAERRARERARAMADRSGIKAIVCVYSENGAKADERAYFRTRSAAAQWA